jgi:hypothetical protein
MDVVQTFQTQDAEAFRDFLASPFFNKGTNVNVQQSLFEVIYEAALNGSLAALEKAVIHQHIYPERPIVEGKIDKLMSELKRLLEDFLLVRRQFKEENKPEQMLHLAAELRQLGLESRYLPAFEKVKKMAKQQTQDSLQQLFFRYETALEDHEWQCLNNQIKGNLNIPESIAHLDTYYFSRKTWLLNHLMLMQRATVLSGTSQEIESNSWVVPEVYSDQSIFLKITWKIYQLLKNRPLEVVDFNNLLFEVQKNESNLEQGSLSEFYSYLRNFCVILIQEGHSHMREVLHEIHKESLARGYFFVNGKLPHTSLLNIVQNALSIGKSEWATELVEEFKDRIIGENETRDFYRMNKALGLFGMKKYEDALDIIPFGSSNAYYNQMARRLELKIYYELHSDLLDHKIDAFKMYISRAGRKVLPSDVHESYSNFANFVLQLSQSEGVQAKKRSETLIKRISEKKKVAERAWLLAKARELGGKTN